MSPGTLAPLAVALSLAIAVTTVHRRLPPRLATRLVVVSISAAVLAAVPTLWLLSFAFLAHVPFLGGRLEWCARVLGMHDSVPTWAGLAATGLSLFGVVRSVGVVRSYRRLRLDEAGEIEVADAAQPFAYTFPGKGGRVIVSSALTQLLSPPETDVVLAHEAAHARFRHDRYMLAARLATTLMPILRPLTSRLLFSLERWADEEAAAQCGDRGFVAETLSKVALYGRHHQPLAAFAALGVVGRVQSLLGPAARSPRVTASVGIWLAIVGVAAFAVFQLHHLVVLAGVLCLT